MMKAVLTTPTVLLLVLVPVVLKMITVIQLMTPIHLNDLRLLLLDQKNSSQTGNCHHTIHIYIACSRKGVSFANCKLCHSNFSISNGGFNNITCHINGSRHLQKLKTLKFLI